MPKKSKRSNSCNIEISKDDDSSSSGPDIDDSPTIKYSLNLSANKATLNTPIDRKRAPQSMPASAQKRVKVSEGHEVSGFNLVSALKKVETKAKTTSSPNKSRATPIANKPNDSPPDLLGEKSFGFDDEEIKEEKKGPPLTTYIRRKPWDEAKKYEMEAMVQMHSAFYENQREQFHAQRQTSGVIFLRKFNNWVKSVLINQTCYNKGRFLSVLDICCGKGGDLQKWQRNRISHYVAVDLSENSVRNASERFKKMKFKGKLPFHAIFMVNNVGDAKNSFLNYLEKRILFDVVSCQMSMHYL